MLNNEKIILMTKMSLYEQNNKKEIKSGSYFRGDYMSVKLIRAFVLGTVAYAICFVIILMYFSAGIISSISTTGNFIALAVAIALSYVIFIAVYMVSSYVIYFKKFNNSRKNLKEYNGDLKTLHRIQELERDSIIDDLDIVDKEGR